MSNKSQNLLSVNVDDEMFANIMAIHNADSESSPWKKSSLAATLRYLICLGIKEHGTKVGK
jgi:hypothetical protein